MHEVEEEEFKFRNENEGANDLEVRKHMARLEEDRMMEEYERLNQQLKWTEDEDKIIIENYEQFKELGESNLNSLLAQLI